MMSNPAENKIAQMLYNYKVGEEPLNALMNTDKLAQALKQIEAPKEVRE